MSSSTLALRQRRFWRRLSALRAPKSAVRGNAVRLRTSRNSGSRTEPGPQFADDYQSSLLESDYSVFNSASHRNLDAEWLFDREKAAFQTLQTHGCESKMLKSSR